ncbi:hypothetical protein [Tropicimonas sediminicola]|uniref:Uncharacterized protein n=1 Tax=Tropicimonas sediminicola TaxID=1031541 RepID=A0A239EU01_9RHOB|nr:hypothetical protein [Tropicimonas sediminicola]SNS48079.1 hypothetical protein SAMN05421757_102331 [Tropicimonas sediminicola]
MTLTEKARTRRITCLRFMATRPRSHRPVMTFEPVVVDLFRGAGRQRPSGRHQAHAAF